MSYLRSAFTVAVSSIVVACALFMFTGSAQAAFPLQVDHDSGSIPLSTTQAGWTGVWWADAGGDTSKLDPGDTDIEYEFYYQGGIGHSDNTGAGGNLDLSPVPDVSAEYHSSADAGFRLELTELDPNTAYNLRWHHYNAADDGATNLMSVYNCATGDCAVDNLDSNNLLFTTALYGISTQNYFTNFVATSDATGVIELANGVAGADQRPVLNGFEILGIVPEPSSFLLLAFGLISLMSFAWRRRK